MPTRRAFISQQCFSILGCAGATAPSGAASNQRSQADSADSLRKTKASAAWCGDGLGIPIRGRP
jgi:hypothetical protein